MCGIVRLLSTPRRRRLRTGGGPSIIGPGPPAASTTPATGTERHQPWFTAACANPGPLRSRPRGATSPSGAPLRTSYYWWSERRDLQTERSAADL